MYLNVACLDSSPGKLLAHGFDVVHYDLKSFLRPGSHACDPCSDHD